MEIFKFKIGNVLTTLAGRKDMEIKMSMFDKRPIAVDLLLTVIERHLVECSGGIQLSYKIRIESISQHTNHHITLQYVMFSELELTNDLSTLQPAEDVSRKDA